MCNPGSALLRAALSCGIWIGLLSATLQAGCVREDALPLLSDAGAERDATVEPCDASMASREPMRSARPDGSRCIRCTGVAGTRGSCGEHEICGSLPYVDYNYCMLAAPCPEDMVSVIDLACAFPCSTADDCAPHRLPRCAPNSLAALMEAVPPGGCAP